MCCNGDHEKLLNSLQDIALHFKLIVIALMKSPGPARLIINCGIQF